MTSFIANQVGGVFTPLVATDKGDISNRGRCAGAQLVNNAQMVAGDVVVLGGAAAFQKSAKLRGGLTKVYDACKNSLQKIGDAIMKKKYPPVKGTKVLTKIPMNKFQILAQKMAKVIGPAKAAVVFTAIATPVLAYIHGRHLYRQGQIDQKYTDRAKVENHSKNIID